MHRECLVDSVYVLDIPVVAHDVGGGLVIKKEHIFVHSLMLHGEINKFITMLAVIALIVTALYLESRKCFFYFLKR
eukprot:10251717-Ditylum_brightwellii.AAC.1